MLMSVFLSQFVRRSQLLDEILHHLNRRKRPPYDEADDKLIIN